MIPWLLVAKLAAPVLAVGVVYTFGYSNGSAGVTRAWEKDKAARVQSAYEMSERARAADAKHFAAAKEAQDGLSRSLAAARSSAASSTASRDSLLNTVEALRANPPSDPDAARRAVGSAAAWDVLGECARTVQTLAAVADGLEARLVGWQAWWNGVRE